MCVCGGDGMSVCVFFIIIIIIIIIITTTIIFFWGGDECLQVLLYVFVWRRLWEATQGPRP